MHVTFYSDHSIEPSGRSACRNTKCFVQHVINHIDNNSNECQFSLKYIKTDYQGDVRDIPTVRRILEKHFSDQILCKIVNKELLILFKNNIGEKRCKDWFKKRQDTAYDERNRIIGC